MKPYRVIPYILTIVSFSLVYWITMVVPNKILLLGYGLNDPEVIFNNKLPLQTAIFTYGLMIAIMGINILEIIFTEDDQYKVRIAKAIITVILIFVISAFIYRALDTKIWNMFFHHRGKPVFVIFIKAVMLSVVGVVLLEEFKKYYPKSSRRNKMH